MICIRDAFPLGIEKLWQYLSGDKYLIGKKIDHIQRHGYIKCMCV